MLATKLNGYRIMILTLVIGSISLTGIAQAEPQSGGAVEETKEQRDQRMAWWRDARFGMFIHWGAVLGPRRHLEGRADRRASASGS